MNMTRPLRNMVLALALTRAALVHAAGHDLVGTLSGPDTVVSGGGNYSLSGAVGRPLPATLTLGQTQIAGNAWVLTPEYLFTLALAPGWNLISFPLRPLDPRVATVFDAVYVGPVYNYNGAGYDAVARVETKAAYWVWSGRKLPATLTLRGEPEENPLATLVQGWNLIGPVAVPPYAAVATPLPCAPAGAAPGPYYGWSPDDRQYFGATGGLVSGLGYWINATQNALVDAGN